MSQVRRLEDPAEVRSWLEDDRRWSAYALADLEEPFWSSSAFWVTESPLPAILLHLSLANWDVLWGHGAPAGLGAILAAIPRRPVVANLMVRREAIAAFTRWYRCAELKQTHRMVVTPLVFQPADTRGVERLYDVSELTTFYASRALGYDPAQVSRGVYYGVRGADGRLLAAAGTHAVAPTVGIGIIGNVFSEPAARGRGLGRRVTSAVITTLFDGGCQEVMLNVRADNGAALAVYRRLGFQRYCEFVETVGTANSAEEELGDDSGAAPVQAEQG